MAEVAFIEHREVVRVDPDRLDSLHVQLGDSGAEDMIARALYDLGLRIHRIGQAWDAGDFVAIHDQSRTVSAIADQIGMVTLSRVAADVAGSVERGDHAALGATLARLHRIGDSAETVLWDLSDMTL